jgi:hypothetical protein
MFYGIIVLMYFFDDKQHHQPHIHVEYNDEAAVLAIPSGEVLAGGIRSSRLKLVQAWIEIHQEELMANWRLAVNGEKVFRIEPLRQEAACQR